VPYSSLRACVADLERHGHLIRITDEVDPHLEVAEIQRRVYQAGGPALLYERVRGTQFAMVSNLFGTLARAQFIFRRELHAVRRLVELKTSPEHALKHPWKYAAAPLYALRMLPKSVKRGPVLAHQTSISALPQLKSWPKDGGAFITLPLVYSEDPHKPGLMHSNLGMYRIQMSGGQYQPDREIGLHYQIHRGIGVHHTHALEQGRSLAVNVFVGGPPAMTLAAVMPLPEGLSELGFAGVLGGRRVRMVRSGHVHKAMGAAETQAPLPVWADADFCIVGSVDPQHELPEGPFGDHLGYYSLAHPFPVLRVHAVFHREGAIWPFTVVGRPPQEDTTFGQLIHELTGPVIPTVLPGVQHVHAVDAAGVHPLLLAIGSERYQPYTERQAPQELLTQAHAILGQGQMSLAKYLLIAAAQDQPPPLHDMGPFFEHLLARVDWRRDLHFQTCTTIDTLDYSGSGFNQGSKLVIAAVGKPRRTLSTQWPQDARLPSAFRNPQVVLPGVVAIEGPPASVQDNAVEAFCQAFSDSSTINRFPLIVIVDDSGETARSLSNFLWITFTRSNPAVDCYGIAAFTEHKHWGCRGSLVIDARIKPHHAPPLETDPEIDRRVDALAARGGPLHGIL